MSLSSILNIFVYIKLAYTNNIFDYYWFILFEICILLLVLLKSIYILTNLKRVWQWIRINVLFGTTFFFLFLKIISDKYWNTKSKTLGKLRPSNINQKIHLQLKEHQKHQVVMNFLVTNLNKINKNIHHHKNEQVSTTFKQSYFLLTTLSFLVCKKLIHTMSYLNSIYQMI